MLSCLITILFQILCERTNVWQGFFHGLFCHGAPPSLLPRCSCPAKICYYFFKDVVVVVAFLYSIITRTVITSSCQSSSSATTVTEMFSKAKEKFQPKKRKKKKIKIKTLTSAIHVFIVVAVPHSVLIQYHSYRLFVCLIVLVLQYFCMRMCVCVCVSVRVYFFFNHHHIELHLEVNSKRVKIVHSPSYQRRSGSASVSRAKLYMLHTLPASQPNNHPPSHPSIRQILQLQQASAIARFQFSCLIFSVRLRKAVSLFSVCCCCRFEQIDLLKA